jgi:hypothetical protein
MLCWGHGNLDLFSVKAADPGAPAARLILKRIDAYALYVVMGSFCLRELEPDGRVLTAHPKTRRPGRNSQAPPAAPASLIHWRRSAAHDSPQITDSPAGFLESWMGNRGRGLRSAPKCDPAGSPRQKKSSAHIQFITSGPTVLGAGPRWADQLNRSNETTKTTPQITTIFSASTSISVPDARERTFATAFIATSKFGLLMRQPECLLAKPARGACEPDHKLGNFGSAARQAKI